MTRSRFSRIAGQIVLMLVCRDSRAAGGAGMFEQIRIAEIAIEDLDTEGVQLSIQFAAKPNRSATVRTLVFDDVTVNGVRVNIPPVTTTINLRSGEWIDPLPPVKIRIPFRDLDSLSPIRRMVAEQTAHVRAMLRAELQLSLFQKLAVRARGVWVAAPVDQDVNITIVGGIFGRAAAVAALYAAEPVWILGREAIDYRERQSDFVRTARVQVLGALALLKTTYSVTGRNGETASLTHTGAGFLLSGGRLLTTAETVEPWAFDPDLAEAIRSGELKLTAGGLEIVASLTNSVDGLPRNYSLRAKELRIHKLLPGGEKAVSLTSSARYKLRMRDRSNNAAMLSISGFAGNALQAGISPDRLGSVGGPGQVAVFRQRSDSAAGAILTEARREGDRLLFKEPVDSRTFGSPVYMGDSVVAMVQDANSAAPIDRLLKDLR